MHRTAAHKRSFHGNPSSRSRNRHPADAAWSCVQSSSAVSRSEPSRLYVHRRGRAARRPIRPTPRTRWEQGLALETRGFDIFVSGLPGSGRLQPFSNVSAPSRARSRRLRTGFMSTTSAIRTGQRRERGRRTATSRSRARSPPVLFASRLDLTACPEEARCQSSSCCDQKSS
jgi:hypothetical protein